VPNVDRVTVFVDYQNVYATARALFHHETDPPQDGHIWPVALGELIVARRTRQSILHELRVYRGLPDSTKQPSLYAVNDRQNAAWSGDSRVVTFRRPLRYLPDWPQSKPLEKGIDVALAVDLVRLASQAADDVAVVFSRGTDLRPALEAVRDIRTTRVHLEVASWKGSGRLRFSNTNLPWCHVLDRDDYLHVRDPTDYLAGRRHQ
jgi:uncharacterized LabA/DUF88 family protein